MQTIKRIQKLFNCINVPPKGLANCSVKCAPTPFHGAHLPFAPAAPQHICLHLRQLLSCVWRTAPIRSVWWLNRFWFGVLLCKLPVWLTLRSGLASGPPKRAERHCSYHPSKLPEFKNSCLTPSFLQASGCSSRLFSCFPHQPDSRDFVNIKQHRLQEWLPNGQQMLFEGEVRLFCLQMEFGYCQLTTLHSKLPLNISDHSFHQNIMVTDDFDLIKLFVEYLQTIW